VGGHRDFKFDMKIDHSTSQPMDDKLSLKGYGHIMTSRDLL